MSTARTLATAAAAVSLGAVALLPTAAGAATPTDTARDRGCATGSLPTEVRGGSFVKAGSEAAQTVWHDGRGWHLRVTKPGRERLVFSGTITTSEPMRYTPRRLEKKDRVLLSSDRRTLSFRFNNFGKIDGLDFVANCSSSVTFSLQTGDAQTPLDRIDLGRSKVSPTSNPFTITRTPAPAPTTAAPAPAPQP